MQCGCLIPINQIYYLVTHCIMEQTTKSFRITPERAKKLDTIDISFSQLVDWALDNYSTDTKKLLTLGRHTRNHLRSPENQALTDIYANALLEDLLK